MSFYEKYLELCEKAGKSPSGAALEIPLSKPTVSRWKRGGGITDATAVKVANYFGVPVEELLDEGIKKDPIPKDEVEDSETAELREIWSSADESERRDLLEMARMLKSRRKQNG